MIWSRHTRIDITWPAVEKRSYNCASVIDGSKSPLTKFINIIVYQLRVNQETISKALFVVSYLRKAKLMGMRYCLLELPFFHNYFLFYYYFMIFSIVFYDFLIFFRFFFFFFVFFLVFLFFFLFFN